MLPNSRAIDSYDAMAAHAAKVTNTNRAMAIIIFILAVVALRKDVVSIVMPSDVAMTEAVEVSSAGANKGYKVLWGQSIAGIIGNISERNADYVIRTVTGMLPAEMDPVEAEKELRAQIEAMKIRQVRQEFVITDVIYSEPTDMVWVVGDKKTASIRTGQSTTEKWTYEFRIAQRVGFPRIMYINQFSGVVNPARREKELLMEAGAGKDVEASRVKMMGEGAEAEQEGVGK